MKTDINAAIDNIQNALIGTGYRLREWPDGIIQVLPMLDERGGILNCYHFVIEQAS